MQLLGLPPPTHARIAGAIKNICEGRKHGALGAWVKTGNFFLDRFRSRAASAAPPAGVTCVPFRTE